MTTPPAHRSSADTVPERPSSAAEPVVLGLYLLFGPGDATPGWLTHLGRETVRIGRQVDDGHLRLDDPGTSKAHAEITWSPVRQRYWLRDLGSTNGSHVNGKRVERELLAEGDILRFGDTVLRLGAVEEAGDEGAPARHGMVGDSPALRRSLALVERVAQTGAPVLVIGETGVGKELVAEALHRESGRAGPLCAVNCAAIPGELVESELFGHVKGAFTGADAARPGLFRAAEGGTLFLDEVGELEPGIQAKLLRALETMQVRPVGGAAEVAVDVRVVAATNRDLAGDAHGGRFRSDLYARLAEAVIAIEPLRRRLEDLRPLFDHFVALHGGGVRFELSGAAFEAMALHDWPHNAREMRQLVRHLSLRAPGGGAIALEDLPATMQRPSEPAPPDRDDPGPSPALSEGQTPSSEQLRRLVEEFRGNIKEVASFLEKDRTQIYRWLKRYGIDPAAYRVGH